MACTLYLFNFSSAFENQHHPSTFLRAAAAECVSSCYNTVHLFKQPCCGLRAVAEHRLLFGQSPAYKVWREGVPLRNGASPPVHPVPVNTTPQQFHVIPRMTVRMFCSLMFFFQGSINSIIIFTLTFVTKWDYISYPIIRVQGASNCRRTLYNLLYLACRCCSVLSGIRFYDMKNNSQKSLFSYENVKIWIWNLV